MPLVCGDISRLRWLLAWAQVTESDLVMAVSSDGVTFQPWPLAPAKPTRGSVIPRTKGGWDNNQQASPTLLTDPRDPSNATVLMLYVGHCTANCTGTGGASYWFGILGASSQDLVHWQKEDGPVVPWGGSVPPWAVFNGEPGWIYGPDGYFYVFPSGGFNVQPPAENFGACGVDAPLVSAFGNCSSCRVVLRCGLRPRVGARRDCAQHAAFQRVRSPQPIADCDTRSAGLGFVARCLCALCDARPSSYWRLGTASCASLVLPKHEVRAKWLVSSHNQRGNSTLAAVSGC